MAYDKSEVGMTLMYSKSKQAVHGHVVGWRVLNGVAYVELYFPDVLGVVYVGPSDRRECREWYRKSLFAPSDEPLVEEKVFEPYDADADECDAQKMTEGVKKPGVNKMPKPQLGKQGADTVASSTNVAMQGVPDPTSAKSNDGDMEMINADTVSVAHVTTRHDGAEETHKRQNEE